VKVSREESLTQAYVLEASDLESLCIRLETWLTKFRFETTNKDSLKREFSTLTELLQFENPPNKDIHTLRISGYSKDLETRVWVRFDKDLVRNIFISMEGDEETAMSINETIENRLAAMKPWYAFLSRQESALLFWCLILLVGISGTIVGLLSGKLPKEGWSGVFSSVYVFLLIIPFLLGVVLARIFDRVKLSIFPMGVFALGQGAKRNKDKEIIRTVVVVAFFISLVSSIVATLILALWW